MRILCYISFIFLLTACSSGAQSTVTQHSDLETTRSATGNSLSTLTTDTTKNTGLKTTNNKVKAPLLFVISRSEEPFEAKEKPCENATTLGYLKYGDYVILLGETGDWYKVKSSMDSQNEYTAFIKKTVVAKELAIPLTNDELNEGAIYTDSVSISGDIEVRLTTQAKFEEMQQKSVNHILFDKKITKQNGVLKLKTKKGYKTFKDKLSSTYNTYYEYNGEINALNAYLILVVCQECEEYRWLLIDKNTGEETVDLAAIPFLSNNQKSMVTTRNTYASSGNNQIAVNDHSDYAIVEFYTLGDSIRLAVSKEFPLWSIAEAKSGFWGSDHWFYLAVLPSFANWETINFAGEDRKGTDYNYRYIKLRLKKSE